MLAAEPSRVMLMDSARLVDGCSACTVRPRVLDNFVRSVLAREGRLRAHLDLVARGSGRALARAVPDARRVAGGVRAQPLPSAPGGAARAALIRPASVPVAELVGLRGPAPVSLTAIISASLPLLVMLGLSSETGRRWVMRGTRDARADRRGVHREDAPGT